MTLDKNHYYLFDTELDDSVKWRTGMRDCYDCGFEFCYVVRLDREVECPRCIPSDRWQRVAARKPS